MKASVDPGGAASAADNAPAAAGKAPAAVGNAPAAVGKAPAAANNEAAAATGAWLDVIGIGDAGLASLEPSARALLEGAQVLVGGARHLAELQPDERERITWPSPFREVFALLEARRGQRVCVLASGDPWSYGVASSLARHFGRDALRVVPTPDAFALACTRLGWPREEVDTLSIHGRPLELLHPYVQPGARLLVLASDGDTPDEVARLLVERGFGDSVLHALEHMGGSGEHHVQAPAAHWTHARTSDLVTLAIECRAGARAPPRPRMSGLPDDAFEHDGQLTKRDIRAITLARLQPAPGQLLWDLGAGCGSVGIEWLRHDSRNQALAVERDPGRAATIARNALALGVPRLQLRNASIDACIENLPRPDAIFVGGAVGNADIMAECVRRLGAGGRLVANGVTLAAEQNLAACVHAHGGDLTRIAISNLAPLGQQQALRPAMTLTQWSYTAP